MISGCGSPPLLLTMTRGLDDGADLHLGDLGEGDAEAAAAQPEHGVLLVQLFDPRQQRAQFLELGRAGLGVYQVLNLDHQILALGQELVQRRIDGADGDGQRLHGLEEADKVGALHGQELLEGGAAVLLVVGRGSWCACARCGLRQRTCARCGRGRCLRRRTCEHSWRRGGCRRWRECVRRRTGSTQAMKVTRSGSSG